MKPVRVAQGDGPVVIGLPHVGTFVPPDLWSRLNERGRALADADWHVDRLYDGLLPGATIVAATHHRYVIDMNRPPDGASLYPGQATTGLVPLTDFEGAAIWDEPPTEAEIAWRCMDFHAPYHVALLAEMARVRAAHGAAILWDAHSIRSRLPYLFDGVLPDLNLGTNGGQTCHAVVREMVASHLARATGYTTALDGRFVGGWTTRAYGQPAAGWHAVQMELAQSTYLADEAPPWTYSDGKAARLRPILAAMLRDLADLAPTLGSP